MLAYPILKPVDSPFEVMKAKPEGSDIKLAGYTEAFVTTEDYYKVTEDEIALDKKAELLADEAFDPTEQNFGLYRRFASLHTIDEMLVFINEFGELGIRKPCELENDKSKKIVEAEFFTDWRKEANSLCVAIQLWDLLNNPDPDYPLDQVLWWRNIEEGRVMDEGAFHYWQVEGRSERLTLFLTGRQNPELIKKFDKSDLQTLARYRVQSIVEEKLQQHCVVSLIGEFPYDHPTLSTAPRNLLGCLWAQFALEVLRRRVFIKCVQCGKEYIDRIRRGFPKRTCSNACRVKLSRSKRA